MEAMIDDKSVALRINRQLLSLQLIRRVEATVVDLAGSVLSFCLFSSPQVLQAYPMSKPAQQRDSQDAGGEKREDRRVATKEGASKMGAVLFLLHEKTVSEA
jgi:hypothetical protein